jgi:Helix-hairpin-helix motif
MTLQHTPRRQDQPIQIGPRHGYRIEGDHAFINAELQVPPYCPGGAWTLELWATEQPYRDGPLTGVKVAQLALELPTPIGPYVHRVDTRTAARLPLQGRANAMVLALIEHQDGEDGQARVHAFANYPEPQTFSGPHFEGTVGYDVQGQEVVLEADGIFNPRPGDNLSGTLSLELWAFPVSGPPSEALRLATSEIGSVAGRSQLPAIERRVAFREPPVGRFELALLLCEWTFAHGYVARDRRDFSCIYARSAPELPGSSQARTPVAVAAPARPVERLRLVPTVVPTLVPTVVPAVLPDVPPEVAAKPGPQGLVSIQTGSVEDLAGVKGLSRKLAQEIVKARPFASLADLIRVRGLGPKTIDRLKGLLTL